MDNDTRGIIEDVLRSNRVVLFMKGQRAQPQCGFSAKTVATLDMLVPDYLDIDVLEHPQIREGIKAYGNWPTIPQLYVEGELIGGADIVVEMLESGELAEVLGVDKPAATTPQVTIADEVAGMIRGALEQRPGMVAHLRIDARWQHTLSVGPEEPRESAIEASGIKLYMEPWTASRADGLHIGMEEQLQGNRFLFDNPGAPPPVQQMDVATLKARLDAGDALQLIDVRPPAERGLASLAGARAWDEDTDRLLDGLPRDTQVVFYCHTGKRSQQAAEYLRSRGFRNVHNLAGGIDAWSREIDPTVPRY